jgi:hypothetical protein
VLKDATLAISQLEKRIDNLTTAALLLITKHPELDPILHASKASPKPAPLR